MSIERLNFFSNLCRRPCSCQNPSSPSQSETRTKKTQQNSQKPSIASNEKTLLSESTSMPKAKRLSFLAWANFTWTFTSNGCDASTMSTAKQGHLKSPTERPSPKRWSLTTYSASRRADRATMRALSAG